MVALDVTDLDTRLITSIDDFLEGLQSSNVDSFLSNWDNIEKDIVKSYDEGTLDSETSSLALDISSCVQLLCDRFMNLEVKRDDLATRFRQDLDAEFLGEIPSSLSSSFSRSPSPIPDRELSPTLTTATYIPVAYSWLLSNLHNPYPSAALRDEWTLSTNSKRKHIDSWFIDVRRRIGWTNLLASSRPDDSGGDLRRRKHRDSGPGTNELKYKCRKDLVAAATEFFIHQRAEQSAIPVEDASRVKLSAEAVLRFTLLEDEAKLLYQEKCPSSFACQVKQQAPEESRRKRSIEGEKEDKEANNKRPRFDLDADDESAFTLSPPASPTSSTFDYSSMSAPSYKRKRATSDSHTSFEPVSPATKRLRTTLNFAGISRSVSDPPRPKPISDELEPVTFSGFPLPMLESWFSQGEEYGVDPFRSSFDPFDGLDPVVRSDLNSDASVYGATATSLAATDTSVVSVPPPVQPYPLSIDLADLSVFLKNRSSSTSSYSDTLFSSPSSPATPALSASGSLTDLSEDEYHHGDGEDADTDDDLESLFGGKDDSVNVTEPEPESSTNAIRAEAVKDVVKNPLPTNSLSPNNDNNVDPTLSLSLSSFSSFEVDLNTFDPTFFHETSFPLLDEFNFDVDGYKLLNFSNGDFQVGSLGLLPDHSLSQGGGSELWAGPTPTRETFASASASS
jgi:hypothetical protein